MKKEQSTRGLLILDTLQIVELFESGVHAGNIIGITPQIDRVTDFLEKELEVVKK